VIVFVTDVIGGFVAWRAGQGVKVQAAVSQSQP
jgi:hypothetical protein